MSVYRGYERSAGQCPLWVKSGHLPTFARCPLYPRKRTWITTVMTSALCQKRTHALQQLIFRFRQNAFRRPDPSRNRPPVSSCLITTDRTRVIQQSRVNGEDEAASAKSCYTRDRWCSLAGWLSRSFSALLVGTRSVRPSMGTSNLAQIGPMGHCTADGIAGVTTNH